MPMLTRPLTTLSAIAAIATLAACEPSLMGDVAGRGNGATNTASNTSGGNNTWNSPRWAANNPQPPQTQPSVAAQNPAQNPSQNGAVAQGPTQQPPWVNGQQPATVQQGGSTVTSVPLSNGGAAAQTQPAVCEDNRPRALDMPGDACARPCRAAWQRCFDGCNNGQDRACVATCDDTFRECMRGCY